MKNLAKGICRLTCKDCQVPGTWRPLNIAQSEDVLHSFSQQQHRMNPNQRTDHPPNLEPHLGKTEERKEGRTMRTERSKEIQSYKKVNLEVVSVLFQHVSYILQLRRKKKKNFQNCLFYCSLNLNKTIFVQTPNFSTQGKCAQSKQINFYVWERSSSLSSDCAIWLT